jgi:hypothetical protein
MAKVEARAFAALRLNGEIESQLRTG